jgi:hypothetical protein
MLLGMAWADGSLARGEGDQLVEARRKYNISANEHRRLMAELASSSERGQHSQASSVRFSPEVLRDERLREEQAAPGDYAPGPPVSPHSHAAARDSVNRAMGAMNDDGGPAYDGNASASRSRRSVQSIGQGRTSPYERSSRGPSPASSRGPSPSAARNGWKGDGAPSPVSGMGPGMPYSSYAARSMAPLAGVGAPAGTPMAPPIAPRGQGEFLQNSGGRASPYGGSQGSGGRGSPYGSQGRSSPYGAGLLSDTDEDILSPASANELDGINGAATGFAAGFAAAQQRRRSPFEVEEEVYEEELAMNGEQYSRSSSRNSSRASSRPSSRQSDVGRSRSRSPGASLSSSRSGSRPSSRNSNGAATPPHEMWRSRFFEEGKGDPGARDADYDGGV